MKKFSYIIFSILGLLVAAVSCKSPMDENPSFTKPTQFVLNTPATATQYYQLDEDMTINFTCSQPDYGVAVAATYTMQVSLTSDFATYETLDEEYTSCDFDLSGALLAEAICTLRGITEADAYTDEPARTVYFRLHAQILSYENSVILSNVVSLTNVKEYCAIKSPGYIYLVGQPEGWSGPTSDNAEHYADWRLYERDDAIGSKVYYGTFEIPAGTFQFRFYSALTGWDGGASIGAQEEDNPVEITMTDDVYEGDIVVPGKGSFQISDWAGGTVSMTVNLNTNKVKFEVGAIDYSQYAYIYLVGAPSSWTTPEAANAVFYEDWKLYDLESNGIYTRTFTIPEGTAFQFRFYKSLTDWDTDSYGSQADDAAVEITFDSDGTYSGEAMAGKGTWLDNSWAGGDVSITVDTNENLVIFQKQ